MDMSWTTAAVPAQEQASAWRDLTRRCFAPLEMLPDADGPFRAAAGRQASRGCVCLSAVEAGSHEVRQTRATIASAHQTGFSAKLVLNHSIRVQQYGEDVRLDPGDIALVDLQAPCVISFPSGCHLVSVFLPDETIRSRLGPRGRPSSLRIRGQGLGSLIGAYIQGLWQTGAEDVAGMDHAMLDHLAALICRAVRDTEASPQAGLQHRMTRERILAEIETNLGDASLSAEAVAGRLRISRSHLYAILAESGTTFSGTLRERRLQAARSYLTCERYAGARVAEIAMRCGYSDAAAFTRAYGKRFSEPPMASRGARQ